MKKHGPPRILETKYLYCNKHGDCEHVLSINANKWKCCACSVDYSSKATKSAKIKAVEYKGGKCELCGYNKSICSLTFHHKDPLLKSFNLSGTNLRKKWETVCQELNKCQMLCFNCHYEMHEQEHLNKNKLNNIMVTNYHKKIIHKINSKKLGKKISP